MNLKQLEYFVQAASLRNITAAANKLHMAQPPLSRQISLLEEELEIPLIKRSNRGIELTEAGQVLYDKAKKVLDSIEEMVEVVKETDSGLRGEIRIGTIYSAIPVFMEQIKYISSHYPLITFKVMHGDPNELMTLLEQGVVDMLFLRSPTCETKDFHYQILQEEDLALVVHRDLDPVPDSGELEITDLKGLPLCMLRSGKYWGYNEFLVNECHKHGFEPHIICECHDTSVALALVMNRCGISYQPRSIIGLLNNPDMYIKPIRNFNTRTYPTLIWNDNTYLTRSVQLFLSLFNAKSGQSFPNDDLARFLNSGY